ncbi:nucleotide pyrophosphatase [Halovulum dunhuangense]|uniref:Nucleotide pyrophosphatase n=1 Tax=Halovulum dunhuangense TaxID=1505036 RepID=A0A849L1D0_9RHOB|nr:alkaline phosphatase family protein [Halovulum dunhuangense]NNU80070.1 nucleotide pyrophosphatase [Halovulum dunhuangense]
MTVSRVVLVVFDGLRPDMIAGRMPELERFAHEALDFTAARSVFPSLTRVCTTSLATGCWPGAHGIVGNAFHARAVMADRACDTSNFDHLVRMEKALGRVITSDTLGAALVRHGKRMGAVHCGSAGAAFLLNPLVADQPGHWTFSIHGEHKTRTPEAVRRAVEACGPLPGTEIPKLDVCRYAGRVAGALALGPDGPDVTVVWLPEPDTSYHYRKIGSDEAYQAMRVADTVFGEIVHAIRSGPMGDETAIVALSDHGQIATVAEVDIATYLREAGLPASTEPGDDTVLAMTRGAAGELRTLRDDAGLLSATVDALNAHPEIGVVFARDDLPGTLSMDLVHHVHDRRPDLFYVMRSDDLPDPAGLPGRRAHGGGVPLGGGMHGGLQEREMHVVSLWQVPGGRTGKDDAPTALVDIAPTVASLLGLPFEAQGRALPILAPEPETAETLQTTIGQSILLRRRIGDRIYLDRLAT